MKVDMQIKKYRSDMELSQEELAEKIYVTRQTISNWENGKSYPDIQSLLLLSSLFNVTLDQFIKGDIEIMKKAINGVEIHKLKRFSIIYSVLLLATIISAVPLVLWIRFYALIPWGILFGVTMYFALKVKRINKENDLHTGPRLRKISCIFLLLCGTITVTEKGGKPHE